MSSRFLALGLGFSIGMIAPGMGHASLQTEHWCAAGFCISLVKRSDNRVLDRYVYDDGKKKQLFIRFEGGAEVSVLLRHMTTDLCPKSFTRHGDPTIDPMRGDGCLRTKDGSAAYRLDYLIAGTIDVSPGELLSAVDPAVWLSGMDASNQNQIFLSPIVAL